MAPGIPNVLDVQLLREGFLKLTWLANPSGENVKYYLVYRGTRSHFVADESSLVGKTVGNSFLDTDVTGSRYYYYKVRAVDDQGKESDPSEAKVGKTPVDKILEQVTTFCIIAIGILVYFYFVYDGLIFDKDSFVLNLDGSATFTNDKLTAIINNKIDPRTLTIYGIDNSTVSDVDATELTDNSGSDLIPFSAELGSSSSPSNIEFPNSSEIILSINSNDIKPGIFEGEVVVQGLEIGSIPIMLATEPLIIHAIIIAGIGILVSIILWEFIKYFRKNNDEQVKEGLIDNTQKALEKTYRYRNKYDSLIQRRQEINDNISKLNFKILETQKNIDLANKAPWNLSKPLLTKHEQKQAIAEWKRENEERKEQITALTYERHYGEYLAEKMKRLESVSIVTAEVNRQAADRKSQQIENYKSRSLRSRSLWSKIIVTEFGSAMFGISLGIFGLLSNDFVLGLRIIGLFEITVLFGLGLGIGSLKEFVDK